MQEYDYSFLLGRLKEKGYSQEVFAHELGINPATFNMKINNKSEFKQSEIWASARLLDISDYEIKKYFFTHKLMKNERTETTERSEPHGPKS